MPASKIDAAIVPQPPAEVIAFVERQIRKARPYKGLERRSDKRYLVATPVWVQPVDAQSNPIGEPFAAVTRDISLEGIGLVHTKPIECDTVALRFSWEGREVERVAALLWCRALGPFYYAGANFVGKFEGVTPNAGPKEIAEPLTKQGVEVNKEIAEPLTKQGVEVNEGRVSAVPGTGTSRGRVDVETVKLAADFVGQYDGSVKDAVAAIETVGGFVEQCGGAAKAKAALEVYESVAAAVK